MGALRKASPLGSELGIAAGASAPSVVPLSVSEPQPLFGADAGVSMNTTAFVDALTVDPLTG